MKVITLFFMIFSILGCSNLSRAIPKECMVTQEKMQALIHKLKVDTKIPSYYVKSHEFDLMKMTGAVPKLDQSQRTKFCQFYEINLDRIFSILADDPRGMDAEIAKRHAQGNYKLFE